MHEAHAPVPQALPHPVPLEIALRIHGAKMRLMHLGSQLHPADHIHLRRFFLQRHPAQQIRYPFLHRQRRVAICLHANPSLSLPRFYHNSPALPSRSLDEMRQSIRTLAGANETIPRQGPAEIWGRAR